MLTPKEFKIALKRLHYKSVKFWNIRMVRRLFDECDKNRDGLLSVREFSNYVQDIESPEAGKLAEAVAKQKKLAYGDTAGAGGGGGAGTPGRKGGKADQLNLSDDEDDEVFRKSKVLTDHQLLRKVSLYFTFHCYFACNTRVVRLHKWTTEFITVTTCVLRFYFLLICSFISKVNDTLMDIVPVDPHGPGRHAEVVRGSVRRFFQRADPEHRGTVSEERFRAFLRYVQLALALFPLLFHCDVRL